METSAKTAMNVNDIFLAIGECFIFSSSDLLVCFNTYIRG